MNNTLKAISRDDDSLTVANYIIVFGGRDLEGIGSDNKNADGSLGEYFTKNTVLDSSYTSTGALYVDWEHGADGLDADEVLGVVGLEFQKAVLEAPRMWTIVACSCNGSSTGATSTCSGWRS